MRNSTPPENQNIAEQLLNCQEEIREDEGKQQEQEEQKNKNTTNRNKNKIPAEQTKTYKQNENYLIFADDTNLFIPEEPYQATIQRLERYSIITKPEN